VSWSGKVGANRRMTENIFWILTESWLSLSNQKTS